MCDKGAYLSTFGPYIPHGGAGMLPGLYDIQAFHCRVRTVFTNTVPVDAYRGAGRPEATFVVERLVEVGAREMGIDYPVLVGEQDRGVVDDERPAGLHVGPDGVNAVARRGGGRVVGEVPVLRADLVAPPETDPAPRAPDLPSSSVRTATPSATVPEPMWSST